MIKYFQNSGCYIFYGRDSDMLHKQNFGQTLVTSRKLIQPQKKQKIVDGIVVKNYNVIIFYLLANLKELRN